MAVVKIDSSNENNFKPYEFKLFPDGYEGCFEVANSPVLEKAKSSDNNLAKVEMRCVEDDEFKGVPLWDNLVCSPKAEYKFAHIALACGTQTQDEIKNNGVDLSLLKGRVCKVKVGLKAGGVNTQTGERYKDRNEVKQYIFDAQE